MTDVTVEQPRLHRVCWKVFVDDNSGWGKCCNRFSLLGLSSTIKLIGGNINFKFLAYDEHLIFLILFKTYFLYQLLLLILPLKKSGSNLQKPFLVISNKIYIYIFFFNLVNIFIIINFPNKLNNVDVSQLKKT